MSEPNILRAPPLVVDVDDQSATLDGRPLELGPKPFALLVALMRAPQRLVTKEDLIETVWEGRFVTEAVLTTAMRELRRALGDDARAPTFIGTAHGRGYRFLRPVNAPDHGPALDGADAAQARSLPAATIPVPIVVAVVFLIAIAALAALSATNATRGQVAAFAGIPEASIAVLPFEDLSGEGGRAHFSDGLAEEILDLLMDVDGLTVASRTSSFAHRDSDASATEIARELGVRHLLEGSVRIVGDEVRVRVRLIDAATDRTQWTRSYERALSVGNLFAIQDEIAQSVVAELQPELGGVLGAAPSNTAAGTDNLAAYENYLRARELFIARSDLPRAVGLARAAVEADPEFARAWELLAAATFAADGGRATPQAREAVARALQLDPNLSLAHAVRGVMGNVEPPYDWDAVVADLERALELDRNNTTALLWLGTEMHKLGYLERAQALLGRCLEIDPAYDRCREHLIWVRHMRGDTDAAIAEYEGHVARGAHYDDTALVLAMLQRGRVDDARAMIAAVESEALFPEEAFQALRDPTRDRRAALPVFRLWAEQVRYRRDIYPLILEFGAYDLLWTSQGSNFGLWYPEFPEYRQSAAFKSFVRTMGIDSYWRAHGFPPQCRAVGRNDFACA
jgi:TolB-like protein/DNA-binding winged helix-turn-helix (wHTH) protein/Tfp pilus assembly protein PilF